MSELTRRHLTRLRQVHRSSGWPCHDPVEVELLVAGYLVSERDAMGREALRLSPRGLERLAESFEQNRRARDAHENLVQWAANWMWRDNRIVWTGLSLLAPLQPSDEQHSPKSNGRTRWAMAMPDVFSIRHTSRESHLEPVVHEIKVNRADLLGDLKKPEKRGAYLAMAQQVYYVLGAKSNGEPIAQAEEIPAECGVMVQRGTGLEMVRVAPKRPFERLRFDVWMALARAAPVRPADWVDGEWAAGRDGGQMAL